MSSKINILNRDKLQNSLECQLLEGKSQKLTGTSVDNKVGKVQESCSKMAREPSLAQLGRRWDEVNSTVSQLLSEARKPGVEISSLGNFLPSQVKLSLAEGYKRLDQRLKNTNIAFLNVCKDICQSFLDLLENEKQ